MVKLKKLSCWFLLFFGIYFVASGCWIPAKALLSQHLLKGAWSESLVSGQIVKPWPWADSWPVARLVQERLDIDLIVLEGGSGEVLAFGPGHLPHSGRPGLGGHCILAGHRDTSFKFLKNIKPGDSLKVEGHSGAVTYQVRGREIVAADNLYLNSEADGFLTLVTCYPFDTVIPGGELRLIVTAERV